MPWTRALDTMQMYLTEFQISASQFQRGGILSVLCSRMREIVHEMLTKLEHSRTLKQNTLEYVRILQK